MILSQATIAGAEQYRFSNEHDQQRFYKLAQNFRCHSCQNQSIAESNSLHAVDMRSQIYNMIVQGKSDKEISNFLAYRYGEHVVYNPPINLGLWALWGGPVLILLGVAWFSLRLYRCISTQQ